MQSRTLSGVVVLGLLAVAVVLFFVLREDDGGDDGAATATTPTVGKDAKQPDGPSKPDPQIVTITVKGGEPAGGVQDLEYARGEQVRFQVKSDIAEEVHVHGYDVIKDVAPGKPVSFDFPADIDGVFEVELEGTHTQIAELRVQPG
jgi:hypothetical protein